MPALKKATKKTVAKKAVGKKSAASAPIVKTQIIKDASSGQIVSKKFAKTHKDTTMGITVERPLSGAAKKAHDKAAKKTAAPAKKAVAKSAPAKKVAAAKKVVAKAPAKKVVLKTAAKTSAVRTATKALDNVTKVAKQASKELTSPSATVSSIEREAAKLGTATGHAIVQTVHAAETKNNSAAKRPAPSAVVTPRQQVRETGFRVQANPSELPAASSKKGPFHPEAVPAAIQATRVADINRPLLKSAGEMFT